MSCYFFIDRAVRLDVSFGLAYMENIVNILFLTLFILRFATEPTVATLLRVDSFIDALSFGSYLVLLFSSCAWASTPPGMPDWTVGSDCTSGLSYDSADFSSSTLIARTWFSFSYLRAWYLQVRRALAFGRLASMARCEFSVTLPPSPPTHHHHMHPSAELLRLH
jgi:hypothetical protein